MAERPKCIQLACAVVEYVVLRWGPSHPDVVGDQPFYSAVAEAAKEVYGEPPADLLEIVKRLHLADRRVQRGPIDEEAFREAREAAEALAAWCAQELADEVGPEDDGVTG